MQVQTEEIRTAEQGALMHVLATTVEALIVVCGHGPASEKAALDHIIAVDPPSEKVQLWEVGNGSHSAMCTFCQNDHSMQSWSLTLRLP